MDNLRRRLDYHCAYHGDFEAEVEWGTEEVWRTRCPQCFAVAERKKYEPPPGIPSVRPDGVIVPYFSQNLGEWVTSRKDFREKQKAKGLVTLSNRDLKDAREKVDAIVQEKKRIRKQIEKDRVNLRTFVQVAQEAEPQGGEVYG